MYSKEKIIEIYYVIKYLNKLFFIGIMFIVSYKNVFFLYNEVLGIKMLDEIL